MSVEAFGRDARSPCWLDLHHVASYSPHGGEVVSDRRRPAISSHCSPSPHSRNMVQLAADQMTSRQRAPRHDLRRADGSERSLVCRPTAQDRVSSHPLAVRRLMRPRITERPRWERNCFQATRRCASRGHSRGGPIGLKPHVRSARLCVASIVLSVRRSRSRTARCRRHGCAPSPRAAVLASTW